MSDTIQKHIKGAIEGVVWYTYRSLINHQVSTVVVVIVCLKKGVLWVSHAANIKTQNKISKVRMQINMAALFRPPLKNDL